MGAQEAAPVLAPQRLLVPVPAAAQRHPEDPGSPPLPGHRVQHQGRALEVVHLGLLPRRVLHDVHDLGPTAPDPPHEPLHREIPVGEAVLLAEVLPDPLSGQTPLHPGLDHRSERLAGAGRTRPRAGDRVWPVLLPENPSSASAIPGAGDRVGRFCRPPRVVPGDRLPPDPGLLLDPAVTPAQLQQGQNSLSVRHFQVVPHVHLRRFRRSVAGFGATSGGRF